MSTATITETNWNSFPVSAMSSPSTNQIGRIQAVLGLTNDGLPRVDEDTLTRYYAYLSANIALPFTAYYPQPRNPQEESQFRCIVVELLDPAQHLGDEFDGIFCRIRKGNFDVNLPLIELEVPRESPGFQMIEDYSYWFWNWR
jgi:hypothetical protein